MIFYRFKESSKKSRSDPRPTLSNPSPFQATRKVFLMSIEDKRDQLLEELIPFEDHLERLTYVIDRAKDNPGLDEEYKIETFLIKGCVSQLWVFLVLLMVSVISRQTPKHPSPKVPPPSYATCTAMKAPKILSGWSPNSSPRWVSPNTYHPTAGMDLPACARRSKPTPRCKLTTYIRPT